ncbi:dihydrolipoyllysine-residue succinyltransferase component of 2-oxoglutarate dehydrogenase complex [Chlamydia ibidis]|uniref:Dihydrolipoyllysine-residue succinyltransferase n=2 Tax=Chlamydia ibidis TaxID=1405396 RepID=S7KMI4_9CHLA|nr:dihydrolipoyllysine-residue succinyltransferase [Chlamydia ibidis]EPP35660.1 dihydrolipoyllysine-residue succinyltransferase component of 2-oxoglutarate dehydrogenase complex [Chlamydia ibidis]EQM62609.1 dihydrolipoyllysine-residue succinyltransferase, E2 component of oxoglutarate dehydrogenase complex [Chlamydia ibidis 10-1398/6]
MITEVRIPNIAESISEVTISSLLVPSEGTVQENQGILEIESDKVNQLIYAPIGGRIVWEVSEGDTVPVGHIVGKIYDTNVEGSETLSVVEKEEMPNICTDAEIISFPGNLPGHTPPNTGKTFVPLKDKLSAIPSIEGRNEVREKMSSIRKTISRRLVSALHESAMLTTFNEIHMTPLINLRKEKQNEFSQRHGVKLGFMSFFVKAVVAALKEYPRVNAYIDGSDIVYREYYDICIAVGTERGLVVPVIRNCNTLSSGDIEKQLTDLASRAREGAITIPELEGGSFTITNGGVYGSLLSTPIINPPQVGILGMHKIEKRPVVVDNSIIAADMMYVAFSYDHRIIDGKEAVGFLVKIKDMIEQPGSLLDI